MAHGSKRWVLAADTPGGRVKRSRHRTTPDRLGRLSVGAIVRKKDSWDECRFCRTEAEEYGLPPWQQCRRCCDEEGARRRAGWNRWNWLGHAPARFRRMLEREFRARVRYLMATKRYEELPHSRPRDAAWRYW